MQRPAKIAEFINKNNLSIEELNELSGFINLMRGIGCGADVANSGEQAVFGLLNPGAIVFDVGANIGEYARTCLALVPNVCLHSFEPSRKTFEILEKNLRNTPTKLNNFGLGEREARLTLYSPEEGSALASLSKRKLDHFGIQMNREETVHIRALDAYCEELAIKHIDLLKIDVEGHEMDVLKGSMRLLHSKSISYVTFEFGGTNIDSRTFFRDFFYFFRDCGMSGIFRFAPNNRLIPINRYTEDLECFQTTNYLVKL